MLANDIIEKLSLTKLPQDWNSLIVFLGIDKATNAEDLSLWETLVKKHVTLSLPDHYSEEKKDTQTKNDLRDYYKNIFKRYWLEFYPQINNLTKNNLQLIEAAKCGYDVFIKNALSKLDSNEKIKLVNYRPKNQITALHYAIYNQHLLTLEQLLINNADVNSRDHAQETPLHYAARNNLPHFIQKLIEYGAQCTLANFQGELPIHIASQSNAADATNELLKADPNNISYKGRDDETAFSRAAKCNSINVLKVLLSHGEDINRVSAQGGLTAMHIAAINNYSKMIIFLKERGAQIEPIDILGKTPLQRAAMQNNLPLESAALLLQFGADANAGTPTPLYLVVWNMHTHSPRALDFVKLLIKHHAKISLDIGESVLDILKDESSNLSGDKLTLYQYLSELVKSEQKHTNKATYKK